jgi:hypothetical protein
LNNRKNLSDSIKENIKPSIQPKDFRVFVFGPSLEPSEVVDKPEGAVNNNQDDILKHARYLRYLTKDNIEKNGFPVDYGETKEVIDLWSTKFKSADLGSTEIHHARLVCGAIIIYPSSIGSFCELGIFSPFEDISKKTLAIVHKPFSNDSSFFRNGLIEVFQQEHGKCEFIDYEEHELCIQAAVKFVKNKFQKMLRDQEWVQYGTRKKKELAGTAFET